MSKIELISMKHTLHVNQFAAKELGFLGKLDLVDLCLFDSFKSFANSMRCEKMIDEGGIWFWISYALIIEEIPFSGLHTKDAIYRRMKKLSDCGIIVFHPNNQKLTKTFFQWGANYDAMERRIGDAAPTDEKPKVVKDLRMKNRRGADEKPKVPTDEKPNNPNTINPTTKPFLEGGKTKNTPTTFDEMIDMVNEQAEASKALKPITKPTHIVTTVEAVTLPEPPKFYQPTNPDAAAKLLSRLEVKPKASDAIEAEKCITDWASENIETVKSRYGSWRKYTQDDLKETIVKFCAWFSNHMEPGTRLRFLSDPALFFRNRLTAWLIEQNKHDTWQAAKAQKSPYQQPEQKYTPPQKPTPPQAYYD